MRFVGIMTMARAGVGAKRLRGLSWRNPGNTELLAHAHLAEARVLVIAIPDPRAARQIVEFARRMNPRLDIIARTHSEREWRYLREQVSEAVLGEREVALEMARYTLRRFGVGDADIRSTVQELRARVEMEQPFEPELQSEGSREG